MTSVWIGFLPHYHFVVPSSIEVFLSCLNQDNKDFAASCVPQVIANGCIYYPKNSSFVKEITDNKYNQLRHIDFLPHCGLIEEHLEFGLNLWLGTHILENVINLKKHFGSRCKTLTFTWEQQLLPVLAEDIHTTLITKNISTITDVDIIKHNLATIKSPKVDYVIDTSCVYNIRAMQKCIRGLGFKLNNTNAKFWATWYTKKLQHLPDWLKTSDIPHIESVKNAKNELG